MPKSKRKRGRVDCRISTQKVRNSSRVSVAIVHHRKSCRQFKCITESLVDFRYNSSMPAYRPERLKRLPTEFYHGFAWVHCTGCQIACPIFTLMPESTSSGSRQHFRRVSWNFETLDEFRYAVRPRSTFLNSLYSDLLSDRSFTNCAPAVLPIRLQTE